MYKFVVVLFIGLKEASNFSLVQRSIYVVQIHDNVRY